MTDTRNNGGPVAGDAMEPLAVALKAWDDCPDHAFPSTVMQRAADLAEAVRAALTARSPSSKEA